MFYIRVVGGRFGKLLNEKEMKTLTELLNQNPIFLDIWAESKKFGVIAEFENIYLSEDEYKASECPMRNKEYWLEKKSEMDRALENYKDVNILFAYYNYEDYSGKAWVLFEENGNLYEVDGGHCSCYGLENQWEKEPIVLEELKNRLENGTFGTDSYFGNEFAKELKVFLGL